MSHALHGPVIQIDLRDLYVIAVQAFWIDREAVILRRDGDLPAWKIFDRLVRTSMSEFQLKCAPSK